MKTIGVLGGIGPQATMAFVQGVHAYSQEYIPASINAGYPPMVVYYCRFPPVLIDDHSHPVHPLQPDPRFLKAAERTGALSDFLVIVANAAHLLQEHVERASGRTVLSMIDVTIEEVRRRGWKKVGVLSLGDPTVYNGPLRESGMDCLVIPDELQEELDQAIFKVMEGANDRPEAAAAVAALRHLRDMRADGIILGCTELPFLIPGHSQEPDLVDPGDLLAEAAVRKAIQ